MTKKQYTIRGHISGTVYARARTLRSAMAKRRKLAKLRFIAESMLDVVDPLGRVVFEEEQR